MKHRLIFLVPIALYVGCDAPHDLGKITMPEAVKADPEGFAQFLIEHDLHGRSDTTTLTPTASLSSMMFGDGTEGDCNYDGINPVFGDSPAPTSATVQISQATTYLLSNWRFCSTMEVASNVAVDAPYPIYVSQLLTLNANSAIVRNGCKPNANTTACNGETNGFLSGTSNSGNGNSQGSCFRKLQEFDHSSASSCAATLNGPGVGVNGVDGNVPILIGCGGGAGSECNTNALNSGQAAPAGSTAVSIYGSGDPRVAEGGYLSALDGLGGVGCAGAGGGGPGAAGGNTLVANGGGGAGWVVVHAYNWTGTGTIEAHGGNGWTYTPTTSCVGGGGGGGGGIITFVTGTGTTFPTLDIGGGAGATGSVCTSGTCTGLHGGRGADGFHGLTLTFHP